MQMLFLMTKLCRINFNIPRLKENTKETDSAVNSCIDVDKYSVLGFAKILTVAYIWSSKTNIEIYHNGGQFPNDFLKLRIFSYNI